jgi:sensor domain CHASE-containing protein
LFLCNDTIKFSEVEASFVDVPDMQEDQILHDAAKVLRGSLHAVEISKDLYPNSIAVMILKPCL